VEGYLLVVNGHYKRDYGLIGNVIADAIEGTKPGSVPRWPDLHSVCFDKDATKPAGQQMVTPFLQYKSQRPIDGLRSECRGHRVRLTGTVTQPWNNGRGAYIVRASGECLECPRG
jgi:hypothetical protein